MVGPITSSDPLSVFKGNTSKGRDGKERVWELEERGKGREREEGVKVRDAGAR